MTSFEDKKYEIISFNSKYTCMKDCFLYVNIKNNLNPWIIMDLILYFLFGDIGKEIFLFLMSLRKMER